MTDDPSSAEPRAVRRPPRYQEILETLRRRIFDGRYPVGGPLPSENELCAEFGSSRFTVREALRRLQADGLVARQQGAGSRVLRASTAGAFVQSYGSIRELLQFARDTDFRILDLDEVTLDDALAATLLADAGERWQRLRGLRLEGPGKDPFAVIESYLPPRVAHLAPRLAASKPPLYRELERATGDVVTDVVQETQAVTMPAGVAAPLGVAPGEISLRLLRRYESARGPLIVSFNWHLGGERFIHRTHLRLQDMSD
jgi:DNA-binding GntR family transcriptional regulator